MLSIEKIANNIKILEEKKDNYTATYVVEPLYRGYGNTIGNALRRVLLSSVPGTAIKGVKIEGVLNEFSTVEGIKEAITDVVLNIKEVVVKADSPGEKKMTLSVKGPKVVTAQDITPDLGVEIVNPEQVIATLTKDVDFIVEFLVDTGEGFVVSDEIEKDSWPVGYIAVDAIYTPIKKISYHVEDTMVGRITNYDKLIMDIETDGSVEVRDAISYAVELLIKHFNPFLEIGDKLEHLRTKAEDEEEEEVEEENNEKDVASLKIEELDLTVRSYNCLKKAGIETLGQLGSFGLQDLLKIKNLGRKSLTEIIDKLKEYGYELKNDGE